MTYFANPEEMTKLRAKPDVVVVTGESGIEYLHAPENVVNPDAERRLCLLTGEMRYQDVLIIPNPGGDYVRKPPYEE